LPQRAARLRRGLLTLVLVSLAAGCGDTANTPPARARVITLDWHERSGIDVDVRKLSIRPNGWSVSAAVRNNTPVSFLIERPHHPGQTEFGLLVLDSGGVEAVERAGPGVFASRFEPPLPRVLRTHGGWNGTFSGQGRLSNARYVRVEFGRFTNYGTQRRGVPRRFRYISDHVLHLR
jgi:hypothetical protein